MRNKV